jgi:uncharacterized protein
MPLIRGAWSRVSLAITLSLVLCTASNPAPAGSGVDCRRPSTSTEQVVCANPSLVRLDQQKAKLYDQFIKAVSYPDAWAGDEERFLNQRASCGSDIACLRVVYQRRIANLKDYLSGFAQDRKASEEEAKLDADFTTLEDGAHYARLVEKKDVRWHVQKRFIAKIVSRVLLERGFDVKSAAYIAVNWDAFRFDPETGERLLPGTALTLSERKAAQFARALPDCLGYLSQPSCRIDYSIELGCRYDPAIATKCQARFAGLSERFQSFPSDPRDGDRGRSARYEMYQRTACLEEGGKGADLVVFAPKDLKKVSKLVFQAVKRAETTDLSETHPAVVSPPKSATPLCSKLGIEVEDKVGRVSGNVRFEGRDVWVFVEALE